MRMHMQILQKIRTSNLIGLEQRHVPVPHRKSVQGHERLAHGRKVRHVVAIGQVEGPGKRQERDAAINEERGNVWPIEQNVSSACLL